MLNEQRQEGLTTDPVLSCGAELLASREKEGDLNETKMVRVLRERRSEDNRKRQNREDPSEASVEIKGEEWRSQERGDREG